VTVHLLEFFEGIGAEGDPAVNGFAGDGAEPRWPAGGHVFSLNILVKVPQPEAQRVAIGTRSPRLTDLALTRSPRLGPLLAPLLLLPLRLAQDRSIAPKRARVVNRRRHGHRLLRAHTPHGSRSDPRPNSNCHTQSMPRVFYTCAKKQRNKARNTKRSWAKQSDSISKTQKVLLCVSQSDCCGNCGRPGKRDLMRKEDYKF